MKCAIFFHSAGFINECKAPGLRVIGGTLRGKKLVSFKGKNIRPTSDRIKESLFNILSSYIEEGARVADFFAGTGNLGIEALSRGAGEAVFIEKDKSSLAIIRKNLDLCKVKEKSSVIPLETDKAITLLEKKKKSFDIIFLDPPYNQGLAHETLELLGQSPLVRGAIVVAEYSSQEKIKENYGKLEMKDTRRYGDTSLSFFTGESS